MDSGQQSGAGLTAPSWRPALLSYGLLLLLVALVFWNSFSSMVATWMGSDSFQHCLLIVPFVLYLVWDKRDQLALITPGPDRLGLILVALASLGWLVGAVASVQLVQELCLVAMIDALVLALFGRQVFRVLLFPLGFLFLMVPMGDALQPFLRDWTAQFLVWSIDALGYQISSDGYFITVIAETGRYPFEVARECSGLRYLTVMFAIGLATAHLFFRGTKKRLAVIGLAVALPLVVNWVRALGIVLLAVETEGRHGADLDHIVYGFWFFLTVLLLFVLACWRFANAPVGDQVKLVPKATTRAALPGVVGLSVVAILLGPAYALWTENSAPSPTVTLEGLSSPAGWREVHEVRFDWEPHFESPCAQLQQRFRRGVQDVDIYVAYYAAQSANAELVQYENRVIDKPWLRKSEVGVLPRAHAHGETLLPVRRMDRNGRHRLVVYWYWVDGRATTSAVVAKMLTAKVRLFGGVPGAGVVAVSARYFDEPDLAMKALEQFVSVFDTSALEQGPPW
jgi:exosortase A